MSETPIHDQLVKDQAGQDLERAVADTEGKALVQAIRVRKANPHGVQVNGQTVITSPPGTPRVGFREVLIRGWWRV